MNDQQTLEVMPPSANVPAVREIQPQSALANVAAPQTAAQAKIDAVANLTFKAYERAATLILELDDIKKLEAEFPDDAFKLGAGGNPNLIYIEHAALRQRLNEVFRPGQWAIIPRNRWAENFKTEKGEEACRVYVEAMLVVQGAFVAEAVGDMVYYPANGQTNYGDAVEGAKSASLRRCAKELGIGLQAWKKDFSQGWKERNAKARNQGFTAPPARPAASPATPSRPAPQNAPSRQPEAEKGGWEAFKVPFGKNQGTPLGELSTKSLVWYCENFEVSTEYNGKPKKPETIAKDEAFRAALDEAVDAGACDQE